MHKFIVLPTFALLLTACGQPVPITDPETGETEYVVFGD